MEYSKIVKQLKEDYNVEAQDVFFAILVSSGCSRVEAYAHIYRPKQFTESSLKNGATALVKSKPALQRLILDLEARQKSPLSAELNSERLQKKLQRNRQASEWNESESAAENGIRILKEAIKESEGKEKAELTLKLLRLVGVNTDIADTVHYYIPISCRDCERMADEKQPRKRQNNGKM